MATKVVRKFKYLLVILLVGIGVISCEKEIENVGVSLVDNNAFSSTSKSYDVITENVAVEKVQTNGQGQYLLGVYNDEEFGELKASIASQLTLPVNATNYAESFDTNASIDSVLVSIPYQATKIEDADDGKPQFTIDSVYGNPNNAFKLEVYELKTFLNTLDPNDPSKNAVYYSDKVFQKGDLPLFSGDFKINPNDTTIYIKRYLNDGVTVYDIDTLKQDNLKPSINIPLNEDTIKQLFIDNASNVGFSSNNEFIHYFRGLYLESTSLTESSHIVSLSMANAKMSIYYSKTQDEEEDEDLNGNDIDGEEGVRTSHVYAFSFSSLKTNVYERNYNVSKQSGIDKLYVQGAAGEITTIDFFTNEEIEELQNNNWLITEANLTFYIDENASLASSNIIPNQLFIYNYTEKNQITDMITEGISTVGGILEYDEDGNPYRYVFKITDYISELAQQNELVELHTLAIKVYNPTDTPTSPTNSVIQDFSWSPEGVVLCGSTENAGDKRVKLNINYTKLNN